MILKELLQKGDIAHDISDEFSQVIIEGLSSDSRYAQKGDLFFARQGAASHGLDYLADLEKVGISAILYEDPDNRISISTDIPALKVTNIDQLMRQLTFKFYEDLKTRVELIGVTGTEGKTSVTQFIATAFNALNVDCGLVGTNGIGFLGNLKENTHTTPDLMALYQSLSEIDSKEEVRVLLTGMLPIAIEVTSHALDQKRVEGLEFKTTIFTNLNRDHLDYHGTLEAYGEAKARLFLEYQQDNCVINTDDAFGTKLYELIRAEKPSVRAFSYGAESSQNPHHLQIKSLKLHEAGLSFILGYQGQDYPLESHLYGAFNAYNLVATIGALLSFDIALSNILEVVPLITNVKGRMEMLHLKNGAVAVVDYAHKPNALKQALISLRAHLDEGKLISIFGCGGNRDTGKRSLMAAISEEFADQVIVTSDNPRLEDPLLIIADICQGFKNADAENIVIEADRAKAIAFAVLNSQQGDIILIAGKGHEDYQILGDREIYFSDFAEVQKNNEEL